jgi:hypothetical protein
LGIRHLATTGSKRKRRPDDRRLVLPTLSLSVTGRIDRLSGGVCNSNDFAAISARLGRFAAGGLRNVTAIGGGEAARP